MTERAAPVVLVAPSGTGKTTLARRLVEDSDRFSFSVSVTTRPPRGHERDGIDYHFVDVARFREMADAGELAEWAQVHGQGYGTPRAELEAAARRGQHVVLDIDVQGARQIRAAVPDAKVIFVLPPSVDALLKRLKGRGTEGPAQVARRLRSALEELRAVGEFDYVVVNDDVDRCLEEIRDIVEGRGSGSARAAAGQVEAFRAEIGRVLAEDYTQYDVPTGQESR